MPTNESVAVFPHHLKLVIDEAPVGSSNCRCYIQGAAHVHGTGRTLQQAVGNMVLTNPLLFNISDVEDHDNRLRLYFPVRKPRIPVPTHPDHQWLTIGTPQPQTEP